MGLFDDLAGAVLGGGGQPGAASPLAGSLLQLLGGQGGGLAGLVQAFGDKGLGDVVGSWVGTGANLPISPQQVAGALGADNLRALAQQHGLDADAVAQQLSQALPGFVDRLTPGGKLPDAGALQGLLKGLLG
jgi:uncharacterized protein YidB (DUF937 family)